MRFVTFEHAGHRHAGVIDNETVISLKTAGFPDLLSVLQGGTEATKKVQSFVSKPPGGRQEIALSSVKLCAPIPKPPKILCMGLNPIATTQRKRSRSSPKYPTFFAKYSNTVIGHGDNIVLPTNSTQPDYEAEFGFVIGKGGRHIEAGNWREHVFGYMNCNDVSARDFQRAVSQWTMGKNFDTFGPMGPWLVSADAIEDPHNLDISLTLNGEQMQHSNTRELIFKIPETIEFLSSVMTLEAGDVVLTGTPAGVGVARKPPRWLTPGAEVIVRVQGLGELRNMCVAES